MPADLDARTRAILDALAQPGADLLYALLTHDTAIERELADAAAASQSTANRRLRRLEQLMIVERQDPGRARAPNRRWRLLQPEAVRELLLAATSLADEAARHEAEVRRMQRDRLQPADAKVRELRRPGS